ncbi:MAG: pilin [Candidatus Caldatribacteriota bacterium]|nr:pilin [Candidatus Caldatribacteriota bacterium]
MKQKLFKLMPVSLMAMIFPLVAGAAQVTGAWPTGKDKADGQGLPQGKISEIIFNLASWLLILLGSIAVIGFVISGILYLTAAGNEDRMETAKKGMIYSVIGVVVGLLGYVIVQAVTTWLGANDAQF